MQAIQKRVGFSLIELLVVIFIIAIFVSLLLPAIHAARETAKKVQCKNNLKQIGIALHNYHDAHSSLPIGARRQTGIGPSWWVGILPYVEQGVLYDKFDQKMNNNGAMSANPALSGDVFFSTAICPSSVIKSKSAGTMLLERQMLATYAGISGSAADISGKFDDSGFTESRVAECCIPMSSASTGLFSAGGMLLPNVSVKFREATDGLSNTMIVGEMNGIITRPDGRDSEVDGSNAAGWAAGTVSVGTPKSFRSVSGTLPSVAFNLTTVMYPVNFTIYNNTVYKGIYPGAGPNNPLISEHDGGVNVLLADGSVKFLSESISLHILKRLATRDDGQILGDFAD